VPLVVTLTLVKTSLSLTWNGVGVTATVNVIVWDRDALVPVNVRV